MTRKTTVRLPDHLAAEIDYYAGEHGATFNVASRGLNEARREIASMGRSRPPQSWEDVPLPIATSSESRECSGVNISPYAGCGKTTVHKPHPFPKDVA